MCSFLVAMLKRIAESARNNKIQEFCSCYVYLISMPFDYPVLSSICLGIALSACCGFRIFIPLLAASVAGINQWIQLPGDMLWMATWPAIICFSAASIIEIVAYYVPFLDNILDTIAMPLAVIAGTLLASSVIPVADTPLLRWGLGLLAGGTAAGTIQAGTGLLRLFSTKATVGWGNSFIASGENTAAVTGVFLSFLFPVIIAFVLLILILYILYTGARRVKRSFRKR